MDCSHRKLSETGLKIIGTFLKVELRVGARRSTGLRYFDPRRYPDIATFYVNKVCGRTTRLSSRSCLLLVDFLFIEIGEN